MASTGAEREEPNLPGDEPRHPEPAFREAQKLIEVSEDRSGSDCVRPGVRDRGYDCWDSERSQSLSPPQHTQDDSLDSLDSFGWRSQTSSSPDVIIHCKSDVDPESDAPNRKPDVRRDDMLARRTAAGESRTFVPFNQFLPNCSNVSAYVPTARRRSRPRDGEQSSLPQPILEEGREGEEGGRFKRPPGPRSRNPKTVTWAPDGEGPKEEEGGLGQEEEVLKREVEEHRRLQRLEKAGIKVLPAVIRYGRPTPCLEQQEVRSPSPDIILRRHNDFLTNKKAAWDSDSEGEAEGEEGGGGVRRVPDVHRDDLASRRAPHPAAAPRVYQYNPLPACSLRDRKLWEDIRRASHTALMDRMELERSANEAVCDIITRKDNPFLNPAPQREEEEEEEGGGVKVLLPNKTKDDLARRRAQNRPRPSHRDGPTSFVHASITQSDLEKWERLKMSEPSESSPSPVCQACLEKGSRTPDIIYTATGSMRGRSKVVTFGGVTELEEQPISSAREGEESQLLRRLLAKATVAMPIIRLGSQLSEQPDSHLGGVDASHSHTPPPNPGPSPLSPEASPTLLELEACLAQYERGEGEEEGGRDGGKVPDLQKDDMMARRTGAFPRTPVSMATTFNRFLPQPVSKRPAQEVATDRKQLQTRVSMDMPQQHPNGAMVVRPPAPRQCNYDDDDDDEEEGSVPDLEKDDMLARRTGAFQRSAGRTGRSFNLFLPVPGAGGLNQLYKNTPSDGPKQLYRHRQQPSSGVSTATGPEAPPSRTPTRNCLEDNPYLSSLSSPSIPLFSHTLTPPPTSPLPQLSGRTERREEGRVKGEEREKEMERGEERRKKRGMETEKEREKEREKEMESEKEMEKEREREMEREKEMERGEERRKKRGMEREKESEKEMEKEREREMEREKEMERGEERGKKRGMERGKEREEVGESHRRPFWLEDNDLPPMMLSRRVSKRSEELESMSMIDMHSEVEGAGILQPLCQSRYEGMQEQYTNHQEEEEEWQDDLARWKSRRRSASQDLIRKEEERKRMERIMKEEEEGHTQKRKNIKTYREILEEKENREAELCDAYRRAGSKEEAAMVLQRYALRFTISDTTLDSLQLPRTTTTDQNPESRTITTDQNPEPRNTTIDQNPEPRTITTDQNPESRTTITDQNPESRTITTDQNPESRTITTDENPESRTITTDQNPESITITSNQNPDPRIITTQNSDPRTITTNQNPESRIITTQNPDPRTITTQNPEPRIITTQNPDPRTTTTDQNPEQAKNRLEARQAETKQDLRAPKQPQTTVTQTQHTHTQHTQLQTQNTQHTESHAQHTQLQTQNTQHTESHAQHTQLQTQNTQHTESHAQHTQLQTQNTQHTESHAQHTQLQTQNTQHTESHAQHTQLQTQNTQHTESHAQHTQLQTQNTQHTESHAQHTQLQTQNTQHTQHTQTENHSTQSQPTLPHPISPPSRLLPLLTAKPYYQPRHTQPGHKPVKVDDLVRVNGETTPSSPPSSPLHSLPPTEHPGANQKTETPAISALIGGRNCVVTTTIVTKLTQKHLQPRPSDMPSNIQVNGSMALSRRSGEEAGSDYSLLSNQHTYSSSVTEGLDGSSVTIESPMLNLAKRVDHWVWNPEDERRRQERWQLEQERFLQEQYLREQQKLKEEWERAQREVDEEEQRHNEEERRILEETAAALSHVPPIKLPVQTEVILPAQQICKTQAVAHQKVQDQQAVSQLQFIQDVSWDCESSRGQETSLDRNQPSADKRCVSGKRQCSGCNQLLGKGTAMNIDTLGLYFHLTCFKCGVCKGQLGDTSSGTDVRIRNGLLSCHDCYVT